LNQLFTPVLIAPNQDIFLHRHKNQTTNQLQLLRFLKPAACRESQFPKFAVYENTKNHVEITRHKNLSFCSKILVFDLEIRPIRGSVVFDGHVRRWYRLSIVPLHFHGKQFYWTKGWKNLIGWERKRWIRWNCQMIIRWYENEPIRK